MYGRENRNCYAARNSRIMNGEWTTLRTLTQRLRRNSQFVTTLYAGRMARGGGIGGEGGTTPWVPLFFGNAADAIYMNAKDNH